jgi:ELWxxDGT repeat protein
VGSNNNGLYMALLSTRRGRVRDASPGDGGRALRLEALEDRRMLAAQFELPADVNAVITKDGSEPRGFVTVGSYAYFAATTAMHGRELWRTDGTAAGTQIVRDIGPGRTDGGVDRLTNVNGTLFFYAITPGTGRELWKSDGTTAGTVMVKDIVPGPGNGVSVGLHGMINVGGVLYFAGVNELGAELWRSDGTEAGTYMLKDVQTGPGSADPSHFTDANGTLFFTNGYTQRLWRSDGTEAGTREVSSSLILDHPNSDFGDISYVNGTVYFRARDAIDSDSFRLWKTDIAGSHVVKVSDAARGPTALTNVGGTLVFSANDGMSGDELWRSDGTPTGTFMLREFNPGPNHGFNFENERITIGNTMYFAVDGFGNAELWKTNGTASGTTLVSQIDDDIRLDDFTRVGDLFYFWINGVWRSDGSEAGTLRIHDADSRMLGSVGGTLLVNQRDTTRGIELYRSDGTPGGLQLLKDINAATGNSYPDDITRHGEAYYYTASDGLDNRWSLWRTDGTPQGTSRVTFSSSRITTISALASVGEWLYFGSYDPVLQHTRLWRAAGDLTGVVAAEPISVHGGPSTITGLLNVDGVLHFGAFYEGVGLRLNKVEPGSSSATIYALLSEGSEYGVQMTPSGGLLYFSNYDSLRGYELWKTDGTSSGTRPVRDINPGPESSSPNFLTDVNGTLYFVAYDNNLLASLWKSNGTAAGTTRIMQLTRESDERHQLDLVSFDGALYFDANDGVHGLELWKTDGTAAGTKLVKDIHPGQSSYGVYGFTVLGGRLYFAADNGVHGSEVWQSNGTSDGTILLRDVYPGANDANPRYFAKVDDAIYFAANDGLHGHELWRIDLSGNMSFVGDVTGDSGSGDPEVVGRVNGRLVMVATTAAYGREVWSAVEIAATGDFDDDGDADGSDFLAWQRTVGSIATPAGSGADGDASGRVDGGDLPTWREAFGAASDVTAGANAYDSFAPASAVLAASTETKETSARRAAIDEFFAAGDFTSLFGSASEHERAGRRGIGMRRRA